MAKNSTWDCVLVLQNLNSISDKEQILRINPMIGSGGGGGGGGGGVKPHHMVKTF